MRWSPRILGVATLVVVLPWSSMAAPGNLALFWDTAGTNCLLTDEPGVSHYYVVHILTDGSAAASFSAP
jgi:hypothetical protein